jgi:DNA-directed RNA polymerase subunit RPC12/RpoP
MHSRHGVVPVSLMQKYSSSKLEYCNFKVLDHGVVPVSLMQKYSSSKLEYCNFKVLDHSVRRSRQKVMDLQGLLALS